MQMDRTLLQQSQVAEPDPLADLEDEDGYYKDVFHPDFDELPGETPIAFRLRYAFACSGYRLSRVVGSQTHPVLIVRAVRQSAMRIADQRSLVRHFQHLLRSAGFRLRRDELTVDQHGDRIMVAFQWKESPVDRTLAAGELAAQFDPIP
jgi:hypothetical protein